MNSDPATDSEFVEADVNELLTSLQEHYQIDFRGYSPSFMSRRLANLLRCESLLSLSDYRERLLGDPECMERFVRAVTVHVTTMFRDPEFYVAFRELVVPKLQESPFLRIWHAGCSTGEEVYSMAIVLDEADLLSRCRIYATDVSEGVLRRARDGIFELSAIREFTKNYVLSGGKESFSKYYSASYGRAIMKRGLKESIVFSRHNLISDGAFNSFDVILCRNVLIYFNPDQAQRAHSLFYDSLTHQGYLGLGPRETVKFTPHADCYKVIDDTSQLFQKVC